MNQEQQENENYLKKITEQLREQLYQAEVVYQWQYKGMGRKAAKIAILGTSIFIPSLIAILFSLILANSSSLNWIDYIASALVYIVLLLFGLLSGCCSGSEYCYYLTPMGIHYTVQDTTPEMMYTFTRGFAWFGVLLSIVGLFFIGPLAFVGAGAGVLMSFSMTNFRRKVEKLPLLINQYSVIYDVSNDYVLGIEFSKRGVPFAFIRDIYTSSMEEKAKLLAQLTVLFPDVDVVKVKRYNDISKHHYSHYEWGKDDEELASYIRPEETTEAKDE